MECQHRAIRLLVKMRFSALRGLVNAVLVVVVLVLFVVAALVVLKA